MDWLAPLFTELRSLWNGFLALLPQLFVALLVLVATWGLARGFSRTLARLFATAGARASIQDLFAKLARAALWFVGLTIAATVLFPSLTFANLVAALGLGSIALGFAFKDVFENFFAGVVILARGVVEIGDTVEWEGRAGRIEEITIRDTHLRLVSGERVIIPNAKLFREPLEVLTDHPYRRVTVICGIGYDEDLDEAREVIGGAVRGCASLAPDRPVQVFARAFGPSSIDFEVAWWTGSTPLDVRRSRDEVVAAVKRALDEARIEIPYPYRTLTWKEPLPIEGRGALVGQPGFGGAEEGP